MKTINNFQIRDKNVLFRADLNVPVKDGIVIDQTRIYSIQSSVNQLRTNNNKIFLLSHFGRPNGKINNKYSLKFLCKIIANIFQIEEVHFMNSLDSREIETKKNLMNGGDICLLENIRFYEGEEKNDLHLAKMIAEYFDVYVNDAFSVSHRNHVSVQSITNYLPSVAGNNLVKEIENLNKLFKSPIRPNAAIIGGSKVSSKLLLLNNMIESFNTLIIGGALANTFLFAQGYNMGKSFVEKYLIKDAIDILDKSKKFKTKIILPIDLICSNKIDDSININTIDINKIESEQIAFDIGENTIILIKKILQSSKLILWNGPLGAFEYKPFDEGTNEVLNIIKNLTSSHNITTIAGGGDTIAAIKKANAENSFTYISTGGGAFLEWLEGKESPGVKALRDN